MNGQLEQKDIMNALLLSFGISYYDFKELRGATVTLYKFRPQIGIKISKIRGLKDELAAALCVPSVRIIAPMEDGCVGIEVPNKERKVISVNEIFNSWEYENTAMQLPCAIGRTVTNEIFMADLTEMPHLLVAGATGQGKSVGLNVIIMSLLKKKSPDELKLILIDPKQVEFSIYSSLENSYLAAPVITETEQASRTLNAICDLMDERYQLLSSVDARNIKEYNALSIVEPLPYIVTVIDEYADLIMTSGKETERAICRIAQKARAVGIHLILATQRPATTIVTGNIKANFPTRIAFRTTTGTDSRVILGQSGAEKLTGNGDMIFFCGSETTRVQCAYASINDVRSLCDELNERYAEYNNVSPLSHEDAGSSIALNEVEYLVSQIPLEDEFFLTKVMLIHLVREDRASAESLGRKVNDTLWKMYGIRYNFYSHSVAFDILLKLGCVGGFSNVKFDWLGRIKKDDQDDGKFEVRVHDYDEGIRRLRKAISEIRKK